MGGFDSVGWMLFLTHFQERESKITTGGKSALNTHEKTHIRNAYTHDTREWNVKTHESVPNNRFWLQIIDFDYAF